MKKINLTNAMKIYREHQQATARALFYAEPGYKDRWPQEYEVARLRQAETREALVEALQPIAAAITAAEGKASARTIDADDILKSLVAVEEKLGITKKAMDGISVRCDPNAQNFPGAYKYQPMSTWFRAEFKSGHWNLLAIYRDKTASSGQGITVTHTEASKAAVIERMTTFSL